MAKLLRFRSNRVLVGDALSVLRKMRSESVQCCVTSPPYWGLRDYGVPGQLGLEPTPEAYVSRMVEIFREVRRVLKDDGTLWLNLGDSYAAGGGKQILQTKNASHGLDGMRQKTPGFAAKQLIGIPWRVAFALQSDGWYLRSDIIWHKPNPMPESVTDRPTKAHEYLFLLAKRQRYYYDHAAVREPRTSKGLHDLTCPGYAAPGQTAHRGNRRLRTSSGNVGRKTNDGTRSRTNNHLGTSIPWEAVDGFRNRRSVWTVTTRPFKQAHFATFPPALVEPCILAGSRPGDTVLDPFSGAGTTLLVAERHKRRGLGVELKPEYADMAAGRRLAA